ncbi:perlucin-like protein [Mytilus trossulus]|uniref:perlucin-like protein n=1 Tax=Mytilus trossulus TaxID=6551 RepID=UPI0030065402
MDIGVLLCITLGLVCPPDWEHHDNSCYYFSNDTLPWDGAQDYCQEFGGYLAELTTTDENNYIEHMSKHYYHPNSTAQGDYIYGYWTGGVKNRTDGYWYWNGSGQKITLFNWAKPEPNDLAGKENCIHINSNEGFKWNDYVCAQNEYFICEKRQARYCPEVIG